MNRHVLWGEGGNISMGKLVFGLSWIFFVHSHQEASFACLFFFSRSRQWRFGSAAADVHPCCKLIFRWKMCSLAAGKSKSLISLASVMFSSQWEVKACVIFILGDWCELMLWVCWDWRGANDSDSLTPCRTVSNSSWTCSSACVLCRSRAADLSVPPGVSSLLQKGPWESSAPPLHLPGSTCRWESSGSQICGLPAYVLI